MKHLGFLLHFYQPPWQSKEILERILEECYYPLLDLIVRHEKACFTVNINYSLVELLKHCGHAKLLGLFAEAIRKEKMELTGSGAYHPILPLLDEHEIDRQIRLNKEGLRKEGLEVGRGFFPPEMAFSPRITTILKNHNYKWVISEDIPFCEKHGFAPFEFIPETDGLPVILRSHLWSSSIAFKKIRGSILEDINSKFGRWINGKDGYLVIGMDAETFGHHHKEYIGDLERFLDEIGNGGQKKGLALEKISEICDYFPKKPFEIPPGSWSTSKEDMDNNIPFPLWNHPQNPVHRLLWQLTRMVLECRNHMSYEGRLALDKALNSCQFWWASSFHQDYDCALQSLPLFWKATLETKDSFLKGRVQRVIDLISSTTGCKIDLQEIDLK
ncbi:MAG TPA: hypothetical protein PLK35_03490 [Candidatus Moranbacteria bacterium]|nr:hypothetical protein [Candidatus Moranbacteria bacterium]